MFLFFLRAAVSNLPPVSQHKRVMLWLWILLAFIVIFLIVYNWIVFRWERAYSGMRRQYSFFLDDDRRGDFRNRDRENRFFHRRDANDRFDLVGTEFDPTVNDADVYPFDPWQLDAEGLVPAPDVGAPDVIVNGDFGGRSFDDISEREIVQEEDQEFLSRNFGRRRLAPFPGRFRERRHHRRH